MSCLNFTIFVSVLIFLTSCQRELENDSSRSNIYRLFRIDKTVYEAQGLNHTEQVSVLFANPVYETNEKLRFAYSDINGRDANFVYEYSENRIDVTIYCKDGETILHQYTLEKDFIVMCFETSNQNDYVTIYQYSYDSMNRLVLIKEFVERLDYHADIHFNWMDENIVSVSVDLNSADTYNYDFSYSSSYICNPRIPLFFISCYEVGELEGVDELLSMQGYFGINTSRNLPDEIYFNGKLSEVYEYEIGKNGILNKILQVDTGHAKVFCTYSLKWM